MSNSGEKFLVPVKKDDENLQVWLQRIFQEYEKHLNRVVSMSGTNLIKEDKQESEYLYRVSPYYVNTSIYINEPLNNATLNFDISNASAGLSITICYVGTGTAKIGKRSVSLNATERKSETFYITEEDFDET